jgi:hypothetical protein
MILEPAVFDRRMAEAYDQVKIALIATGLLPCGRRRDIC